MKRVSILLLCSLLMDVSIARTQTIISTVPPLDAQSVPMILVQCPAPAPLNLDQIIAAIADLKATMTQQHADQTTFWKQFEDFFQKNWPTITAAFGAYLTCHASGKC